MPIRRITGAGQEKWSRRGAEMGDVDTPLMLYIQTFGSRTDLDGAVHVEENVKTFTVKTAAKPSQKTPMSTNGRETGVSH